ncbi:MAG: TraR/DksA C4-type zinc finger protein [Patescibacteria group bacterium]
MVVSTKLTSLRLQEIKAILEGMQEDLSGRLQTRKGEMKDRLSPSDRPDDEDSTVAEDIEIALVGMRTDNLHEVERALLRIKAGTYGRCKCGDLIAYKRLKAVPTVGNCNDCAERAEASGSSKRRDVTAYLEVPLH